jgi:hypothetical protein
VVSPHKIVGHIDKTIPIAIRPYVLRDLLAITRLPEQIILGIDGSAPIVVAEDIDRCSPWGSMWVCTGEPTLRVVWWQQGIDDLQRRTTPVGGRGPWIAIEIGDVQ